MRVLLATPAFGGLVTTQYLESMIHTIVALSADGIEGGLFTPWDSLISRARNTCALQAIRQNYDKLLFIDADMIWTPEMVRMLLKSEAKVVGGTYPLKTFPIVVNFNPLPEQRDLFGRDRELDNYRAWCEKYADPVTGEAEVAHIPTGFMLIDLEVFAKLSHTVPHYATYHADLREHSVSYDFFPCGTHGQEYESEDWGFCRLVREAGFKVMLQTKIVTGHTGVHHYHLGEHMIGSPIKDIGAWLKSPLPAEGT